jgi:plasmid maintenance system antidote protein VapI
VTGGEALAAILDVLDIPQSAFAQDAGISAKHLNQLVQGNANFTPETTAAIADGIALRILTIDTRHRMQVLRSKGGTP